MKKSTKIIVDNIICSFQKITDCTIKIAETTNPEIRLTKSEQLKEVFSDLKIQFQELVRETSDVEEASIYTNNRINQLLERLIQLENKIEKRLPDKKFLSGT